MLNKSIVEAALRAALSTGADFAELFAEDRESDAYSMVDGKLENAVCTRECGAGIRILLGTSSIYAYTNHMDEKRLIETALKAAAAVSDAHTHECAALDTERGDAAFTARIPAGSVSAKQKTELLRSAHAAAQGRSISQVTASLSELNQRVLIANSEGLWAQDARTRTRFSVTAVAADGAEMQTGSESPGYSMGFEMFDVVDVESEAQKAALCARTMLSAELCPAGQFPVIVDGGFGGVIFHEACAHSLEATSVGKGNSVFCGKLGQQIASSLVTAVDDGTLEGEWGSIRLDDEGREAQRTVLIENGILKSYLIDMLGARRTGLPETGNGRRQSYRFAPTSRMTNTFIEAGQDDEEAIIKSIPEGLYAKTMGGGSVNPLTGEFNFSVREGYWIKNGVIDRPVRGATLIGKGADVLMRIDRVGKLMWLGTGVCGSLSGQVPTCVGQPMIRISELTVGGKGGKA